MIAILFNIIETQPKDNIKNPSSIRFKPGLAKWVGLNLFNLPSVHWLGMLKVKMKVGFSLFILLRPSQAKVNPG